MAGPMRGYPDFNFPAFLGAAKRLRDAGHEVFCPAERDKGIGFDPSGMTGSDADMAGAGFDLRAALGADLAWITASADAVVVLDGWEASAGANAEVATARALSLLVQPLEAFLRGEPVAEPAADLPDGEYARVEILGHDSHTGWVTESTRAGQPVMVVRNWDGFVIAEVPGHSLYRFVPLATPLKRPEPRVPAAITAGDDYWDHNDDDRDPF